MKFDKWLWFFLDEMWMGDWYYFWILFGVDICNNCWVGKVVIWYVYEVCFVIDKIGLYEYSIYNF